MTAKEYLSQIRVLTEKIRMIESNIDDLRAEILRIHDVSLRSAWPDGQPHGTGTTDPTGNAVLKMTATNQERIDKLKGKLQDYEIREYKAREELWKTRMEITETISQLKNRTHIRILHLHYVKGWSWEKIAVDINYTVRHVWNLHGQALSEIDKIISNR